VGREPEASIEPGPDQVAIDAVELLCDVDIHDIDLADPGCSCPLAPDAENRWEIRDLGGSIDGDDGTAVHAHVSWIAEDRQDVVEEPDRGDFVITLPHQDVGLTPVPPPRPVLVRPHHAEGEVDGPTKPRSHRAAEELDAGEPVVVVHEPADSGFGRKSGLEVDRFVEPQIVEASFGR